MELNRAFDSTLAVLAKVQPAQLGARTPCASWDVRALINHFTGTTRWWAGTLDGHGEPATEDFAAGDFVAAYEESIQIATAAFGADGAQAKLVQLPWGEFPGAVVFAMATMEQFTHGWDLAKAIGLDTDLDPEFAVELLGTAKVAITDMHRGADGEALFGPVRAAPAGASAADQLAAFLGRSV